MRKQNSKTEKPMMCLCAALCVCLLCAGFTSAAPGYAAEPISTPRMITRRPSPPVTPSPTPSPTEAPPVLVQVHYVTEKGSVLVSAGYPLKETGIVEADPDVVPEGYELAGETACLVQVENGTAGPDPVRFLIRKKPTPSPVPTPTPVPTGTPAPVPVPEVFVPVFYVTENGSVLLRTEYRLTASGTVRADPEAVPEGFELSGETAVEVRLENGIAEPASVEFTVRRKVTPSSSPTPSPSPTPTPTPIPTPTPLSVSDFRTVGNIVRFGHYEQDSDTANGPEEIEWIVLDVQGNKALLLSRYGLDAKPYYIKTSNTWDRRTIHNTWEECELRNWLNNEFMAAAFSGEEQQAILTTSVDNSPNQHYCWFVDVKGGKNTEDKIFLLSYAEANRYLEVTREDIQNIKSRAMPTKYAISNGAYTNKTNLTADGTAAGWWWLRSVRNNSFESDLVLSDGSIYYCKGFYGYAAVRPAVWVNLESETFVPGQQPANTDQSSLAGRGDISVGDTITFGRYPQTAAGDDLTPIEWLVLDVQENKALLLSRYGLDAKPYNINFTGITWENCTLRTWLNGEFMSSAFSQIEQGAVLTTAVDNSIRQGWITNGGNNTRDRIFLLSYAEANKYLGVTLEDSNNMKSRTSPTVYALKAGAWTSDSYKMAYRTTAGWWWLRSPGGSQDIAAVVNYDGSLYFIDVHSDGGCVRPALWIDLDADTF